MLMSFEYIVEIFIFDDVDDNVTPVIITQSYANTDTIDPIEDYNKNTVSSSFHLYVALLNTVSSLYVALLI